MPEDSEQGNQLFCQSKKRTLDMPEPKKANHVIQYCALLYIRMVK